MLECAAAQPPESWVAVVPNEIFVICGHPGARVVQSDGFYDELLHGYFLNLHTDTFAQRPHRYLCATANIATAILLMRVCVAAALAVAISLVTCFCAFTYH
ncbi:MAG: hypothetical protein WC107_07385 [Patescibacteria group bacterium]